MKYSLRKLLVFITILSVMAATLRMRSPHSVLVMLACALGLLSWAATAAFSTSGLMRRALAAAAVSGVLYLVLYVFTDTVVEAWINAIAIAPFASMKAGGASPIPSAELPRLAGTMEYQYFQQKVHLLLSVLFACFVGWLATS